jgi:branched-chain amino acid transport system substrate-binding protein
MRFHQSCFGLALLAGLSAAAVSLLAPAPARAADPIRIGFGMSLTGPLSANGKSSLLAMKIWEDDTNAKGGLLGRQVKLVYFDDQSNPSTVPGIYTKLLDVDKVDRSSAATRPARLRPQSRSRVEKLFISLFGTGVNEQFKYDRCFQ